LKTRFILIFILFLFSCGNKNNIKSFLKEIRANINNTKPLPKTDYIVDYINNTSIIGIDVSHHQKKINWPEVKNWKNHSIKFVYIKATEGARGNGSKDPKYLENIQEAEKHGLLVGSYHYFRTTSSAEDQFKNFITTLGDHKQDLIPMVDLEQNDNFTKKKYREELKKFLKLLENHFNKKPIIYSVTNFYNQYLAYNFLEYKLFLGFYNLEHDKISLKDNRDWTAWQFSQQGKIKGIEKNVDINVLNKKISINELLLK
tara:strand:+ start:1206 stop:1979 length:774 start_codon:yes stop_codon:yes gene_type:complete